MNNYNVTEVVKDFGNTCIILGESYAIGQNRRGNIARAKYVAYYKRFVADRKLFCDCMDILLKSDNINILDSSSHFCLSLHYREDDAVKILTSIRDRSKPDYNSFSALAGLCDWEKKGELVVCEAKEINRKAGVPISQEDIRAYVRFIRDQVGDYKKVYYEQTSKYLPIDVIVVPPTAEKDYYTLVSMGAFYYKMPVPEYYERMNRAEYAIRLPSNWKIDDESKEWQWPIEALRTLARVPFMEKSWLGWYHDVKFKRGFSKNTRFSGFLLDVYDEDSEPLVLENGDKVILYNAIPIYSDEIEYCYEMGGQMLLKKMSEEIKSGPLNNCRATAI